jgi:hypothetical protein
VIRTPYQERREFPTPCQASRTPGHSPSLPQSLGNRPRRRNAAVLKQNSGNQSPSRFFQEPFSHGYDAHLTLLQKKRAIVKSNIEGIGQ